MESNPEGVSGTQSISRVFTLLRELAAHNREGMRLVDIAQRLDIETPTAHRILKCLVEERALKRDADSKRYFLGPTLFELGVIATPAVDLRAVCAPVLERLAEQTEDMVFLTQRSGLDCICLSRKEGKFPVKTYTLEVGMRRPLGIGAGSLAILSALPAKEIRQVLAENATRFGEHDELTANMVMSQVRRTQKQGYAVRDLRGLGGVRTVGAAIRTDDGNPVAALSLSAIRSRMKDDRVAELAALLQKEAAIVEKQIAGARGLD
jgi:DNA-binding IclR family transcriptional regulator